MNFVVDIGNTRVKAAIFHKNLVKEEVVFDNPYTKSLEAFIDRYPEITKAMVSSVSEDTSTLAKILNEHNIQTFELNENTRLPFINKYTTPSTLGKDRVAAIAGAAFLYPNKPVLVIDTGTALTFDLKTADNEYLGGNISPGMAMRFRALNTFTARLPLLSATTIDQFLGSNTQSAIISGVTNGQLFEIEKYIETLENQYPQLIVILTGGDSSFFENKLKKTIFAISNLILIGLNTILDYNVQAH